MPKDPWNFTQSPLAGGSTLFNRPENTQPILPDGNELMGMLQDTYRNSPSMAKSPALLPANILTHLILQKLYPDINKQVDPFSLKDLPIDFYQKYLSPLKNTNNATDLTEEDSNYKKLQEDLEKRKSKKSKTKEPQKPSSYPTTKDDPWGLGITIKSKK